MKRCAAICVFAMLCASVVFGQAAVPARWIGTWALNSEESELGQSVAAGAPNGQTVFNHALEIAVASGRMKIAGGAVIADLGSSEEEFVLNLDGRATVSPGGLKLSFKGIDNLSFDLTASVNNNTLGNHVWENHFVFSADGNKLTDTRTDTKREEVPRGWDPAAGKVISTSTSVLVFDKMLFIPRAGPVLFKHISEER